MIKVLCTFLAILVLSMGVPVYSEMSSPGSFSSGSINVTVNADWFIISRSTKVSSLDTESGYIYKITYSPCAHITGQTNADKLYIDPVGNGMYSEIAIDSEGNFDTYRVLAYLPPTLDPQDKLEGGFFVLKAQKGSEEYIFGVSGEDEGQYYKAPKKGDVNSDGGINSTDLTYLKRIILGTLPQTENNDKKIPQSNNTDFCADINSDGSIDSTDLTLLKRIILKIDVALIY